MFDPKIRMKTEEFIKLLKENVKHPFMSVKMIIKPTRGWDYELSAFVHNIVGEPIYSQKRPGYNKKNIEETGDIIIFISNAFSDQDKKMNTNDILDDLAHLTAIDGKETYIAFEIYGTQKEEDYEFINNQIVTAYPSLENITVVETEEYVSINIGIDCI